MTVVFMATVALILLITILVTGVTYYRCAMCDNDIRVVRNLKTESKLTMQGQPNTINNYRLECNNVVKTVQDRTKITPCKRSECNDSYQLTTINIGKVIGSISSTNRSASCTSSRCYKTKVKQKSS